MILFYNLECVCVIQVMRGKFGGSFDLFAPLEI